MDTTNDRTTGPADDPTSCVLLTVEAAAARLSISRTRMYALLKTGDVTSFKVGRLRRIHATELDAFAARLAGMQSAA